MKTKKVIVRLPEEAYYGLKAFAREHEECSLSESIAMSMVDFYNEEIINPLAEHNKVD